MRNIIKALSKQLYGAKYEAIKKSVFISLIVFFSIYVAQIKLEIAPFILFLSSIIFTTCEMWKTLSSSQNTSNLEGIMIIPFNNRKFVISYTIVFCGYTLITKSLFVMVIFFSLEAWSPLQIITAIMCCINSCIVTILAYSNSRMKRILPILACGLGIIITVYFIKAIITIMLILSISIIIASLSLVKLNAYDLVSSCRAYKKIKNKKNRGKVLVYLYRYIYTNKVFSFNTLILWGVACILPLMINQFNDNNIIPIGLAITCFNTPASILLSSNHDLEEGIKIMPNKERFIIGYGVFIYIINIIPSLFYRISWQIMFGGIGVKMILTAFVFVCISSILTVIMEWFFPIHNWKIESDLWHHPRKYFVAIILMLISGVFILF